MTKVTGGYEWHDRLRDEHGRFAKLTGEYVQQIHIRMTKENADRLREACRARRIEVGKFCRRAINAALEALPLTDNSGIPTAPRPGAGVDGGGQT